MKTLWTGTPNRYWKKNWTMGLKVHHLDKKKFFFVFLFFCFLFFLQWIVSIGQSECLVFGCFEILLYDAYLCKKEREKNP